MMDYFYLKLYHEILHDPKMGMLPDHLWRRAVELFLLASEQKERDGFLPTAEQMGWVLHASANDIENDLVELEKLTGVVQNIEGRWFVKNFAKRQAPSDPTAAERMQRYRERNSTVTDNNDVTRNVTRNDDEMLRVELKKELELKLKIEEEERGKNHSSVSTALAINEFNDFSARDAAHVYSDITGQPVIPPDQYSTAIPLLLAIIPTYTDKKAMIRAGQIEFTSWCKTRGKNGREYSRTNTGWISRWYEKRAPDPGANGQAPPRIDHTGATCGEGKALLKRAQDAGDRNQEANIEAFRTHVDGCRICGNKEIKAKPMPEALRRNKDGQQNAI